MPPIGAPPRRQIIGFSRSAVVESGNRQTGGRLDANASRAACRTSNISTPSPTAVLT